MQRLFRKYIFLALALSGAFMMTAAWILLTADMRRVAVHEQRDFITQVNQNVIQQKEIFVSDDWANDYMTYGQRIAEQLQRIPLKRGQIIFAANENTGEIYMHTLDDLTGQSIYGYGVSKDKKNKYEKGYFTRFSTDQTYFCVLENFDGTWIGTGYRKELLYQGRTQKMVWMFILWLSVVLLVQFTVSLLLSEAVVKNIQLLLREMESKERGNTDIALSSGKDTEFYKLAVGINHMIQTVENSTGRISRAIEMADLDIAAYEYYENMNRVKVTERLGNLLGIDERTLKDVIMDRAWFEETLQGICSHPEREEKDVYRIIKNEEIHWIRILSVKEDGAVLGILMDVTEDIQMKRNIRKERDLDALTELYNRRHFEKIVTEIMDDGPFQVAAMIMMDLDCFKGINDNYGHEFGDVYLKYMADCMRKILDERIVIGRRSGDEFYMFFHHFSSEEEIENKVREFYDIITEYPIAFPDGSTKCIGLSSGIYYCKRKESYKEILAATDEVLYQAKENGRGRYESK